LYNTHHAVRKSRVCIVKGNCFLKNFASTLHAIKSNVVYGALRIIPRGLRGFTNSVIFTIWGKRFLLIKKDEDCTETKKINVQWRIFTGIKLSDLYDSPFNAPPASNNLLRGKCFTSVYACSMSRTYLPAHEIPQIS